LHSFGSLPGEVGQFIEVVGSASISSCDAGESAIRDLVRSIRSSTAEEVLISLSWQNHHEIRAFLGRLRALPLTVKLLADDHISELLKNPLSQIGGSIAVEVQRAPLSLLEQSIKRSFDVLCSMLALIALCPLLAAIAALIKLDSPGPVVFRQRRNGFNGREFSIYKFRTMTVTEDGAVVTQAMRNDRRVTRVGAVLRRFSLDEVPQLLNVFRGEMSLVGPRPHAVAHDDHYGEQIAKYAYRQHVKPGITGWSQVNGLRGETVNVQDMQRRVILDLWYIDHWTIWLDLWILLRTVKSVALARNAY